MGGRSSSSKATSSTTTTTNQNLQGLYGLGSGVDNETTVNIEQVDPGLVDVAIKSLETAGDSFEDSAGMAERVSMEALSQSQKSTESAMDFALQVSRPSSDVATENIVKYLSYAGAAAMLLFIWKAA